MLKSYCSRGGSVVISTERTVRLFAKKRLPQLQVCAYHANMILCMQSSATERKDGVIQHVQPQYIWIICVGPVIAATLRFLIAGHDG